MNITFGTDGIRGKANCHSMTAETMLALARTLSRQLLTACQKPKVIIGKDTRLSGYMLETALASGFISEGVDVVYTGPIPTPAIPCLIRSYTADLGIMLTASHNPWYDNGIKIFDAKGDKINNDQQNLVTQHIGEYASPNLDNLGQALHSPDARRRYTEHIQASINTPLDLRRMRIVLDCAHGAAYRVAPDLLSTFQPAALHVLHNQPDGRNINHLCGATHTDSLQKAVVEHQADIGLAFDGDADRLIAVDQWGKVIDGDQIIAAIAHHWCITEGFDGDVVFTLMSNLALDHFLQNLGLTPHRAAVGDRNVVATMKSLGARLGGEQSGHMIFRDFGFTGDGILTALNLLQIMQQQETKADQIGKTFAPMPQKLVNIAKPQHAIDWDSITTEAQSLLGENSQLLLRPSGTEPLIRIMAQDQDTDRMQRAIDLVIKRINKD